MKPAQADWAAGRSALYLTSQCQRRCSDSTRSSGPPKRSPGASSSAHSGVCCVSDNARHFILCYTDIDGDAHVTARAAQM